MLFSAMQTGSQTGVPDVLYRYIREKEYARDFVRGRILIYM